MASIGSSLGFVNVGAGGIDRAACRGIAVENVSAEGDDREVGKGIAVVYVVAGGDDRVTGGEVGVVNVGAVGEDGAAFGREAGISAGALAAGNTRSRQATNRRRVLIQLQSPTRINHVLQWNLQIKAPMR